LSPFKHRCAACSALLGLIGIAAALSSCATYDSPPRATIVLPQNGAWKEGEPVVMEFSEPIKVETLVMRLWPDNRDLEGKLKPDTVPFVKECRVGSCGDVEVTLSEDRMTLQLVLPAETIGKAGPPILLELLSGLEDDDGNPTGASPLFTLQYRSALSCDGQEMVPFDSGTYILGASVTKPLPAILTLISDVKVTDDGAFALAGAEGDEFPGFAKNTLNPDELFVDTTDLGWALFVQGQVCLRGGQRLLQTTVFDVRIPLGDITVILERVRLVAEIKKDEASGKDKIEGTLSFESAQLVRGARVTKLDGGNTPLVGVFVPPEKRPEGTPDLCTNVCGAVTGLCEPPMDFPEPKICAVPE
jgi:hypothetical protein